MGLRANDANRHDEASPKIILNGIDTLELHSTQPLLPKMVGELASLKAHAQKVPLGHPLPTYSAAGMAFTVSPRASMRGQFLLEAPEALAISINPSAPKGLPTVSVEIRSLFLWQGGRGGVEISDWHKALGGGAATQPADDAVAVAEEVIGLCVLEEAPDVQVSRIDVTCDFQGWVPSPDLLTRFKTRARSDTSHRVSRKHTGWTFGTSAVRGRLYDKTEEIRGTDKAGWFPALWARNSEYDPQIPVHRLEGQVRRAALRELGGLGGRLDSQQLFKSWRECRAGIPSLWRYLWEDWLSLRLPRTGKTRQRVDPRWAALIEADWESWECAPTVPLKRLQQEARFNRTLDQLAAYLARGMAERWALQGHQSDLERTAWALLNEAIIHLEKKRGTTLKERVDELWLPMKAQLEAERDRRASREENALDQAERQQLETFGRVRGHIH